MEIYWLKKKKSSLVRLDLKCIGTNIRYSLELVFSLCTIQHKKKLSCGLCKTNAASNKAKLTLSKWHWTKLASNKSLTWTSLTFIIMHLLPNRCLFIQHASWRAIARCLVVGRRTKDEMIGGKFSAYWKNDEGPDNNVFRLKFID